MIWFILYILTIIASGILLYLSLFKTFDKNGNKIEHELYVYILSIICLPIPLLNLLVAYTSFPITEEYIIKSILCKKY